MTTFNQPSTKVDPNTKMLYILPHPYTAEADCYPVGLREQKKQLTRQTILAKSARLFESQGFVETSMDQIAAEAVISRTTLFNYFPSKDDIVLAMAGSFESTFPDTVRQICAEPGTTAERITRVFIAAAGFFVKHRALNSVIYLELMRIRSTRTAANNNVLERYREAFVELLELGVEQGDVRTDIDPDIIADFLWTPLSAGLYRIFSKDNEDANIEAIFRDYARLLVDSIVMQ